MNCIKDFVIELGGCPHPETGTPTSVLSFPMLPGSGLIGILNSSYPSASPDYWSAGANFPLGQYTIAYFSGVMHDDNNPCPYFLTNAWKFQLQALWNDGANTADWTGGYLVCDPDPVQATALVISHAPFYVFSHSGGKIGIVTPSPGANPAVNSAPLFTLTQNYIGSTPPNFPSRLRIRDYDPNDSIFVTDPDCDNPELDPVLDPVLEPLWEGIFPVYNSNPPFPLFHWSHPVINLNGYYAESLLAYNSFGNPHNPTTGAGWKLSLWFNLWPSLAQLFVWQGWKSVGDDPVGWYYRDNGCSLVPDCIYMESY